MGPFASCVSVVKAFYADIEASLHTLHRIDPHQANLWRNLLTVHNLIRSSGEYPDLFKLLDVLVERSENMVKDLDVVLNMVTPPENLSRRLAKSIRDKVDGLKRELLSHPINIVMAAFLVDEKCLFDYDNVAVGVDVETQKVKYEPRSAKSFLDLFPYEYLSIVYKISYEIYVNKRSDKPLNSWFTDAEAMAIFHERAREDIREAR